MKCQLIASVSVIGLFSTSPSVAYAETHGVNISVQDFFFESDSSEFASGETVTIQNDGSATHEILGTDLNSGGRLLAPGEQISFELTDESVTLSCAIHLSMQIELVVTPSPSSTTLSELAYTGPGNANVAVVGVALVSLGFGAWLLRQRRSPIAASVSSLDFILPVDERERRSPMRRPPIEY